MRKKACRETVTTNMEMVICRATLERLGCDTILDVAQTNLTDSTMLKDSIAPIFIYVRHG